MSILITGFGPFDGGSNASEALVRALEREPSGSLAAAGSTVHALILPVDTERAGVLLDEAIARLRPLFLLMCGQAAGRDKICLERVAINRRHFGVPDAGGAEIHNACVLEGGADRLAATWPDLDGAVAALRAAGIPAAVSEDCGTHLCNQMLYHAIHSARGRTPELAITFMHVPLLPEQAARKEPAAMRHPDCPTMSLETMLRAVKTVLHHATRMGEAA